MLEISRETLIKERRLLFADVSDGKAGPVRANRGNLCQLGVLMVTHRYGVAWETGHRSLRIFELRPDTRESYAAEIRQLRKLLLELGSFNHPLGGKPRRIVHERAVPALLV